MRICRRENKAFTVLEMLVVIAIIGIIAGMVLGLAGMAARKKKDSVAGAAVSRLTLMIQSYHDKLGFYPPDNARNVTATGAAYEASTATNQLLYELTGERNYGGSPVVTYINFDGTTMKSSDLNTVYGRGGIANANPEEPHNFYYPQPKPTDYTTYPGLTLEGLIVPLSATANGSTPNFIHYDSSSTIRHNPGSFDVWVEYWAGTDKATGLPLILTNGNW